jgi:hypothetical protein
MSKRKPQKIKQVGYMLARIKANKKKIKPGSLHHIIKGQRGMR